MSPNETKWVEKGLRTSIPSFRQTTAGRMPNRSRSRAVTKDITKKPTAGGCRDQVT